MQRMSVDDRRSLIRIRMLMLIQVLGKRVTDDNLETFLAVYVDSLQGFGQGTLTRAFKRAEQELERFPTPKILKEICNMEAPSNNWRYNFTPGVDDNGVPCLIDPDPDCDECREPIRLHPTKKCFTAVDKRQAKFMYRPQNCEEGREFLAKLKEFSAKR